MRNIKIAFIIVLMAVLVAACGNKAEIDGMVVNHKELQSKIEDKNTELSDLKEEISNKEEELKKLESSVKENADRLKKLERLEADKDEMDKNLRKAKSDLDNVNLDIGKAKEELEKLRGEVVKTKGEPQKISAGYYNFGSDVDPGRYKVTAQPGGRGNFFVRDSGGTKVNIILGGGSIGIDEYIFSGNNGDEIESNTPFMLYPVE